MKQGGVFILDTTAVTGNFGRIYALAAATFSVLTDPSFTYSGSTTVANIALPAGAELIGRFTAITLATGKVIAYNA